MNTADARARIMSAGADMLSRRALATVTIRDVAHAAGVSDADVHVVFPTVRDLAVAILDHERASMRGIQSDLAAVADPAERLTRAFGLVGRNLAHDVAVRAGVRIAGESRDLFPERRLDPFATWQAFVRALLSEMDAACPRLVLELDRATWVIVAAGLGAVQIVRAGEQWDTASDILERTASDALFAVCGGRS